MNVQAGSARRPLVLVAGFSAVVLIAFGLLLGKADGRSAQSCKEGAEKAGCKLPVNATYVKDVKTGSAEGSVRATVVAGGVWVLIASAYIDCKKFDPAIGDITGVADDYSGKQRPKVGKTYTINKSDTRQDEDGGSSTTTSQVKLTFKSAKQLVLTLHQVSEASGKLLCDGGKTWTLKRE